MKTAYYFDSQETLDKADNELTVQGYVWRGTHEALNKHKPSNVSITELVYVLYPEDMGVAWSTKKDINADYNLIPYYTILKDTSNEDIKITNKEIEEILNG